MTFAVLCPGQGAQHPGMLDLVREHPAARTVLDAAHDALGADPRDWLARPESIFENAIAQPLICLVQLAQWNCLHAELPRPAAVAGYSVGELACYGVAAALDAGSLALLAVARARAMDNAAARHPGSLAAVRGPPRATLERACEGIEAHVAIVNDDDGFVVGGTQDALAALQTRLAVAGAQWTALRVGVASHTPLLADAVAHFRAALTASPLGAPAIPVVAGIDATLVRHREQAIATLSAQLAQVIEWAQCIDVLHERGCRVFLELGPGQALCRMVRERHDDVEARGLDEFRDLAALVEWVRRRT